MAKKAKSKKVVKKPVKKRPVLRTAPWSGFRLVTPRGGYLNNVSGWTPNGTNDPPNYEGDHLWGNGDDYEDRRKLR